MDREVWSPTVHGVTKLHMTKQLTHTHTHPIFIFAFFLAFPKSHPVLEEGIVNFLFYHVNFLSHCISEKFKPEVNPAFVHLFYQKQPLNSKCLSINNPLQTIQHKKYVPNPP